MRREGKRRLTIISGKEMGRGKAKWLINTSSIPGYSSRKRK